MDVKSREQLETLRQLLGRRRFRIALLRFGKNVKPREIAGRLRISKRMVNKDLAAIERDTDRIRRTLTACGRRRSLYVSEHAALAVSSPN